MPKTSFCACGCGVEVPPGRKWANRNVCSTNLKWKLVVSGEVRPYEWGECLICGGPFPRYAILYHTTIKTTCCEDCRREATRQAHKARLEEKGNESPHYNPEDRSKKCMTKTHICKNFATWMIEPELYCKCTGFDPVLKPCVSVSRGSVTGGRTYNTGMSARIGGSE